jgi:hypothetical protein
MCPEKWYQKFHGRKLEDNLKVDIPLLDVLKDGCPLLKKLILELDHASFTYTFNDTSRPFVQHRIGEEIRTLSASVLGPKILEKREEGVSRITFERL